MEEGGVEFLEARRVLRTLSLQEPGAEKTNNGIHYRLRLVYNNGEWGQAWCPILKAEEPQIPEGGCGA